MVFIEPKTDLVKVDAPRPLTDAERQKIRNEKFGGDASVDKLNELASKFAKVGRDRSSKPAKTSVLNNGWSR